MSAKFSVIVADDHPLMRAGIKQLLSNERFYHLIAVAQTGEECLELIRRHRPDLALIDSNISQPGAVEILRESKDKGWQTRICFLTEGWLASDLLAAAENGVAEFANERSPEDLRDKLREIAIDLLNRNARASLGRQQAVRGVSQQRLTPRQKQIVEMLKIGSSNRQIARVLGLSEGTIKVHLHRIYQRIGVSNRTELAAQSLTAEYGIAESLNSGEFAKI